MSRRSTVPFPMPGEKRPSLTRSQSARRQRLVEELRKGRPNSWKHGVFSEVAAWPDVATEIALTFAAHPSLSPIEDARLVELLATTNVQRHRALLAIERDGMSPQLTSYDSRLAALVERLERAVHERALERAKTAAASNAVDLAKYSQPRAVQ